MSITEQFQEHADAVRRSFKHDRQHALQVWRRFQRSAAELDPADDSAQARAKRNGLALYDEIGREAGS